MSAVPDMFAGFRFDQETHTYTLNGRRLPSVTEIIACLHDGYASIPPAVLEHARQRGTAVHAAIQYHGDGDLAVDTLDLEIVPYFESWLKFLADTGFRVEGAEQPLYSRTFMYAGTPDLWGSIGADLWLPDIKATSLILPHVSIQTAGYQRLLQELTGRKARRAALQLKDDGTYRFNPYPQAEDAADMGTFTAALNIHQWRQKHGRSRTD